MASLVVWRQAVRKGLSAARANLLPGILLQVVALAILLAYFFYPPFHELLSSLQHLKERWGVLFAAGSTCLFGAFFPFLLQRLLTPSSQHDTWKSLGMLLLFWGYKGVEIDLFYRSQAWLFGTGTDAGTLACKVAFDQFVYSTIWSVPTMIAFYTWKDCGFGAKETWAALRENFWSQKVLPALLSNWGVWVPAVTMIYCLPTALQLVMQNLVLCIFVLLISVLSRQATGKPANVEERAGV